MQRLAATGRRVDLVDCARLLTLAPDDESRGGLIRGFEAAFKGRTLTGIPEELSQALERAGGGSGILALRRGNAEAINQGLKLIADEKADAGRRLETIQTFGEVHEPRCVNVLLGVIRDSRDDTLRMAALMALGAYDDASIGPNIIDKWANFPEEVRQVALSVLAGRKGSALALLTAIDRQTIDRQAVPLETVRRMTVYRDDTISQLINKLFGTVEGSTTAQMQSEIERLAKVLKVEHGDPYAGKKLFTAQCAKCHTLFAQGGQIGPDLTAYKRDDLDTMLLHIVNPSAEIREGFETLLIVTDDGRTASGFLVDRDSQVVVLRGADGQNVTIAQSAIEETQPQRRSLMPEGLLKDLSEQQIRDLFAYLRSSQPLNE
jgi:putative heme-binding domain-containing protein